MGTSKKAHSRARTGPDLPQRFRIHKGGGHAIEPRGVVARFDAIENLLTVWDSTQMPHKAKRVLVESLGLAEHQIRVIAPDVGGGFGPKNPFYPEELAVPAAALLLKRPIKWIEDRRESFTATNHERLQDWDMEVAVDADGRLCAIRGHLRHDHGAATPSGLSLPQNAVTNLIGPYVLPALRLEVSCCLTNMVPATSTRGAGRSQGTFVMERLLDRIADELALTRDEVRRRNLIAPQQMPYVTAVKTRDGLPMTYDSGDYVECQRRALAAAGWTDFPARRAAARAAGRALGIGLANYVEGTGRGPFESASVRIGPSGKVTVTTGAADQGQGTQTMLAQIAALALGIRAADVKVTCGDTAASPLGLGAYASRQAVTAGNAVHLAARMVARPRRRARRPLHMLEAAPEDLGARAGRRRRFGYAACRSLNRTLKQIAHALDGVAGFALPANLSPGAAAATRLPAAGHDLHQRGPCGGSRGGPGDRTRCGLTRYLVVHDCGRMIQPDDGRGHDQWRRRPRHQRHPARMDALRRCRPAAHRHLWGLPAADRGRGAAHRDPSHGIADAAQSARRQGRGRERHDRSAGRDRLRHRGRAAAAASAHHRAAGDPGTAAGVDRGGAGHQAKWLS